MTRRRSLLAFGLVFLPALALYLSTLAPSITWAHAGADGGDLISAAYTNGVAHPPGYPTYITLGRLFMRIPIGTVAYRFNVMSAVCMALAASLTAVTLLQFDGTGVAVVSSLFFATAPLVWSQAVIAEVHALNAFLVAAIAFLVAPIVFRGESVSRYRLALAAWIWGVGFGNSLTIAALAPLLLVAWWRSTARGRWLAIAALILGLSVYALVPLRALAQPPINWGNAITLPDLIAQISAEMYRGYAFALPLSELFPRMIAMAQLIVIQYGWLGLVLGAIGARAAVLNSNRNWWWLALTMLLYSLFALGYNTGDSQLYLIPVWMFGAWAIARGTLSILHSLPYRTTIGSIFLMVILLGGPVLNVITSYSTMDLRNDHAATDFARNVAAAAPAHAIVITESDTHTFTLWYSRFVEQQRPDLAVVDRRLSGYSWYDSMLHAQEDALRLPDYEPQTTWPVRLTALNPERAICAIDPQSAQMMCQR